MAYEVIMAFIFICHFYCHFLCFLKFYLSVDSTDTHYYLVCNSLHCFFFTFNPCKLT